MEPADSREAPVLSALGEGDLADLGQIMPSRKRDGVKMGAGGRRHRPAVGPVRTSSCCHGRLLPRSNDRVVRNPDAEVRGPACSHVTVIKESIYRRKEMSFLQSIHSETKTVHQGPGEAF